MTRKAIVQPLLLAALLAIGAGAVLAVAVLWSSGIAVELAGPKGPYERLVVSSDGTPLISSSPSGYRREVLRELDGTEIPGDEPVLPLNSIRLSLPQNAPWSGLDWPQRIISFADQRRPPTYWYFIHDGKLDGGGYFVGYDSDSKALMGYLGATGFRADKPPAEEWIPVDGRLFRAHVAFSDQPYSYTGREPYYGSSDEAIYVAAGNRVLEVNFRERSVKTVRDDGPVLGIAEWTRPISSPDKGKDSNEVRAWRRSLIIRTSDRLVFTDTKGRLQGTYLLPAELQHASLTFWEIKDGEALVASSSRVREGERYELYWINAAGKVMNQRQITLETHGSITPQGAAWRTSATVPAPIVAVFASPLTAAMYINSEEGNLLELYRQGLGDAVPSLVAVGLLAVVMAALCYRRQRRYAQPWTAAWVIFVLVGGLPGWIGYLVHRRWPVLEACPACGQPAPRDRDRCAHCGAEFAPPAPQGVEVFAA